MYHYSKHYAGTHYKYLWMLHSIILYAKIAVAQWTSDVIVIPRLSCQTPHLPRYIDVVGILLFPEVNAHPLSIGINLFCRHFNSYLGSFYGHN